MENISVVKVILTGQIWYKIRTLTISDFLVVFLYISILVKSKKVKTLKNLSFSILIYLLQAFPLNVVGFSLKVQ